MRKINVLSLFDGISCGRVALERAGFKVEKYYASEIDKYAISVAQKNYPDTIQLGDINNWREWDIDWSSIDLLLGGFCCQSWSIAGKQQGDKDPRGQLLWVMIDIHNHIKKYNSNIKYLFENVKMKKEFKDYIDNAIGSIGTLIDSSLVSAQSRKRLYWMNIPGISRPKDKGILLKDIVHENTFTDTEKSYYVDASYHKGGNAKQYYEKSRRQQVFDILKEYIVPFDKTLKILDKEVEKGKVGYFRKDSQANRVYYIHDKAVTLCGAAGGGAAKMGQYLFGCITPDRVNKRQNGQRFSEGKKFYTLTAQDKHGILIEGYIRKLTPIECERLQTLPDNYTEGISNSQRYKALGNGFTADVIAHILKSMNL